jgi:thermitase
VGVFNKRLRSAITYAQKRGLIIVAAAGNFVPYVVWPAAYEEVIAVTGCDVQREIWKGSARGRQVDVTAPCDGVWCAKAKKKNGEIEYNVEPGTWHFFMYSPSRGDSGFMAVISWTRSTDPTVWSRKNSFYF